MNILKQLKEEVIILIQDITGVTIDINVISVPPKPELGDLAVPMFSLTKVLKKTPQEIASELENKIQSDFFAQVKAVGQYLNFFVDKSYVASKLIPEINKNKEKYSENNEQRGKKIMVEYFSPNTNKAMTVGHLRNVILGATLVRLIKKAGANVIKACLYNDRGIAIAKSMVAYQEFGEGKTPESEGKKPDQFVGEFYVLFGQHTKKDEDGNDDKNDPLMVKATKLLQLWEDGDKDTIALWKKMNGWVYDGYNQTLAKIHEGDFDDVYYESDFWYKGKQLVLDNVGKGVIKKADDGAVYADLEDQNLGKKFLLRSDGTSLYATQDLVLDNLKDKHKLDKSIWVVADEQNYYLQQLFAILQSLKGKSDKYIHFSYGMMRLPEGKIKSRSGATKAMADGLIEQLENLARNEVAQRQPELASENLEIIANQIMNAALKFYILNVSPAQQMVFDPQKAISFTGKTGPYLQYTAVRLNSILSDVKLEKKVYFELLEHELENKLISKLSMYQKVMVDSLKQYNPQILTTYLHELAQLTNSYYVEVPVLQADDDVKNARLALIHAISIVLTDGLAVCGIEVPEKM